MMWNGFDHKGGELRLALSFRGLDRGLVGLVALVRATTPFIHPSRGVLWSMAHESGEQEIWFGADQRALLEKATAVWEGTAKDRSKDKRTRGKISPVGSCFFSGVWGQQFENEMRNNQLTWSALAERAKDRVQWRRLTEALCPV